MRLLGWLYPGPIRRIENDWLRRMLLGAVAGLFVLAIALVALIAVTVLRSDDPDLATNAPPLPAGASGTAQAQGGTPLHFVVDKGSQVKTVVREQLTVAPVPSNAVGIASGITGDLYLTKDGLASGQTSSFTVDLLSLKSDEALRDRAMRGSLATDRFPTAKFTIESITGFPAGYNSGREVEMTMTGSMTIRETTKPLTFKVFARQGGDYLTAIADTDFKMTEFGITPPNASITRVEDGVHLQVTLIAKLQK
jgi:polyisoprenoid-binding protein YceI